MKKRRIIISKNPLEPSSYETYEDVEYVREFIMEKFPTWPETARIYFKEVSQVTDITPHDQHTINRLEEIEDDLFIIVYPEGVVAAVVALVVVVVAAVAVTTLAKPKVPDTVSDQRNRQVSSPNNELAERTNRPRVNGRIPDIYGTVRSTPDLIAPTYNYYENNRKVEIAYMAVGRGEYVVHDVKDADTHLAHIAGSSAQFYLPNQSPKSGHLPFLQIGSPITDTLYRAKKLEQVVGQELRPPNSASAYSPGNFKFRFPDEIYNTAGYNFQDRFRDGDQVAITNATYTGTASNISAVAVARYFYSGGWEYIEWQAGNPSILFEVGDTLQITAPNKVVTKKPFTVTWTGPVTFTASGRLQFSGNEPVESGYDFRPNKDFSLTNASWTNDFSGTYNFATPPANGNTRVYLADGTTTLASKNWNRINTVTAYINCTVNGINRNVRFYTDGSIELQSGNWNDLVGQTSVTLSSNCAITYHINGTYEFTSRDTTNNYWVLDNPAGVDADWNAIRAGHEPTDSSVTISQTHSTDTFLFNPSGVYTVTSVGPTYIGVAYADWSVLQNAVNERTEYGSTDTFFVAAPTRTVNLNGTYNIISVGQYSITLSNPAAVNPDWNKLQNFPGDQVIPTFAYIYTTGGNWVGPFFIDNPDCKRIISSFIAPSGLYDDDGKTQRKRSVNLELLVYPATSTGIATGAPPQSVTLTLTGSAKQRDSVAASMNFALGVPGYSLIFARRITPKDTSFNGQVVDTVKWEEVFHLADETKAHFGNVTTVLTKTYATGGALALKERKFNCLVTRKIPIITGWTGVYPNLVPVYAPDLAATRNAFQIFCAMSTDPFFGKRDISEIDTYNIAAAVNHVYEYFGEISYAVTEFCYTFDSTNISYEEAAQAIANAVFCTAYRQGSTIRWRPEAANLEPSLIFNHRNKIPNTETRTVRFGSQNDHDSIQLEWVDPSDDSIQTFFIPEDQSGGKPKKIETVGIRNLTQATFHAWRAYYKTRYQNTAVEFDATQEAAVLVHTERVLCADNTRADVQDGEIWYQDVLQLTLSQPVTFKPGQSYTIFIQHTDGTVEGIPCTPVPDNLHLIKNVYLIKDGKVRFPVVADAGNFSVGDVVQLVSTSFTDPVNGPLNMDATGYIVGSVNALTGEITFSNALTIDNDWSKITDPDGHLRMGVNFISNRNNKRKVNLAYAPRHPLSLSPQNYTRATYILRSNAETAPQEFIVQETSPRDNFTYRVSLINYDPRYYYLDDLEFWMNFDDQTFRDSSARGHIPYISTAAGKATIAFNAQRNSYCFHNPTNSSAAWVHCNTLLGHLGSYTKAFWIRQGAGYDSYFLSNQYEAFRVNNNNRIIAGHNVGGLSALSSVTWPSNDGLWHHACCTYDVEKKILSVYVDGVKKAQKVNVLPPSVSAPLQIIGLGSSGVASPFADDIRYWRRAFTDSEVLDLYNATK